jgi:hypothetical protein
MAAHYLLTAPTTISLIVWKQRFPLALTLAAPPLRSILRGVPLSQSPAAQENAPGGHPGVTGDRNQGVCHPAYGFGGIGSDPPGLLALAAASRVSLTHSDLVFLACRAADSISSLSDSSIRQ